MVDGEDHLVDGGRCDAEVLLNVGFSGRPSVDAGICIDEGEILTLLGGEAGPISARLLIHLSIHLVSNQEAQMNVRYRVELAQYERTQLGALLSGGKHSARKLKRAQILLADTGASDEAHRHERRGWRVDRLPDQG